MHIYINLDMLINGKFEDYTKTCPICNGEMKEIHLSPPTYRCTNCMTMVTDTPTDTGNTLVFLNINGAWVEHET